MELKNFISKSIMDICLGIQDAQRKIYDSIGNMPIAPGMYNGVIMKPDDKIHFDVSVSVSEQSSSSKEGAVRISVIAGNMGKKSSAETLAASRIQFSVPFYPQALEDHKEKRDV